MRIMKISHRHQASALRKTMRSSMAPCTHAIKSAHWSKLAQHTHTMLVQTGRLIQLRMLAQPRTLAKLRMLAQPRMLAQQRSLANNARGAKLSFFKLALPLSLSLVLSSLVSGCSLGASEVNLDRYTLTQDIAPESYLNQSYSVNVALAPILNQGGVVIQVSDVSLRPAKNYRYSANLDNELKLLLIDELNKAQSSTRYRYDLFVSKFQGTLDGEAIVEVSWQVSGMRSHREVLRGGKELNSALSEDGYEALVLELKNNYLHLIKEMIAQLPKR